MLSSGSKVFVRSQKHQLVPSAELNKQGIDGANLNPAAATGVAYLRSLDVVLAVGLKEREGSEPLDKLPAGLRASESLEQFLKNDPGREHLVGTKERLAKYGNFRRHFFRVPPKGK